VLANVISAASPAAAAANLLQHVSKLLQVITASC
jgi:hypothetical protein